ncbi:alcohol acetyltransferase [Citricoccus sp. NPDC079358]|uniref:alcohol acetyltransferase n=1 Tax=Citricoccus sp. NPDC079358 TaxID=3154653 RepID=UPI00344B268F
MTGRTWVRLDNASNIFLAARTDADPKVFRLSAELDHEVDPQLLQEALDATYDRYPLYRAVLRRGVFWYYLQDSDLRPLVSAEVQHTCAPIYQADRRTLLFRVLHHRRRINLEVFHALSDGTGALWFLSDLVTAYLGLRYPEAGRDLGTAPEAGAHPGAASQPAAELTGTAPAGRLQEAPVHELTADSFAHYFRRHRRDQEPATDAARPARKRVHRVRGTRTPDHRTRAVELTLPARDVLGLARAEGVSLTMYLTALFFESVRRSSGGLGRNRTLAVSVPVNLRQFFPSTSARNFFAAVRVEHTYGEGEDDVGSVARQLEGQFRPKATPEALERKLRRFIRFERTPVLRVVPRPLKDLILGLVNRANNRGLTVAISNMGRVSLPDPVDSHVGRMLLHVSAARPQFCAVSHAGLLTISFSSPFTETGHVREFARHLTDRGIAVSVAAARVTEEELRWVETGVEAEVEP